MEVPNLDLLCKKNKWGASKRFLLKAKPVCQHLTNDCDNIEGISGAHLEVEAGSVCTYSWPAARMVACHMGSASAPVAC